jgi:uncharacterized Zn finger protein
MSEESVQFIELIREQKHKSSLLTRYCQQCQSKTPHSVRDEGREEIYTCQRCGYEQSYTVR